MSESRAVTNEYRLSKWAQIISERAESGLTIKRYCEVNGHNSDMYYYWQRKLRKALAANYTAGGQHELTTNGAPSGWFAVKTSNVGNGAGVGIPIEIGRCRVTVGNDTDMALLARVCTTLASIC